MTTAEPPSEICEALPAVTLPAPPKAPRRPARLSGGVAGGAVAAPAEGAPQAGQALGGGAGTDALVAVDEHRLTPALGDRHRHQLGVEAALLLGGGGPLVGAGGEDVHHVPADGGGG